MRKRGGFARPCWLLAALWLAAAGSAAADEAGDFDYYVLALSWNASWCEAEGDRRGAEQCAAHHDHGFLLHGLWPQREEDWPEHCQSPSRDPSRRETAAMADLYGSAGLAWYQWKKHGRCSGLSSRDYFRLAREAWRRVARPAGLRSLGRRVSIDPAVVQAAFLEANPALDAEGVVVTCRDGRLSEVRVCLTRGLEPRPCSRSALRLCQRESVDLPAMR